VSNADCYVYLNEPSVSDMLESKWFSSRRFKLEIVGLIFESDSWSNQRLLFPALQSGVPCYEYRVPGGWVSVGIGQLLWRFYDIRVDNESASTQYLIYYYYLLQLSFYSVAVVLTLVTNKNKYT